MRQLAAEVEQLKASGQWTLAEYHRINREAVAAGGDAPGARDWLLQEADPAWHDQLVQAVL
ncbi:MAG: hypothetical protein N2Z75_04765 [Meiothermus sp.]|nr:hypothetical protein [Meiothermus sp.]